MHHPKILFLDEPTLGLDPQSREHIWKYIEDLAKQNRMTIIITTHYMDEADKLCDRLAIIDKGKIVVLGSPKKLKKDLGGDIIRLKTKQLHIDELQKLPYVKNISRCDGEVCLTLEDANTHLQEILQVVGKIDSVEIRSPTLDDVFLHYTGRAMRDGSPEGGWAEKMMNASEKR